MNLSMSTNSHTISYAFFGSDEFSIGVLKELVEHGFTPTIIVSVPDSPQGRKLVMTPTPLKLWAIEHNIPCTTPDDLKSSEFISTYTALNLDLAIVASYGKIIPGNILSIPRSETLNVHPSLLPKWRGSSPIQNTILYDDVAGVTIMHLDEKMDHGPIILQETVTLEDPDMNPPLYTDLRDRLAQIGGRMLAECIEQWIKGEIKETPQVHGDATYSDRIQKKDAEIFLTDNPYTNIRKIRAYSDWPVAYFIIKKDGRDFRVKITEAKITDGKLDTLKVIPEGKNEMDYESFKRGYLRE